MLMVGVGIQVNRIQMSVLKHKVELQHKVMCGSNRKRVLLFLLQT